MKKKSKAKDTGGMPSFVLERKENKNISISAYYYRKKQKKNKPEDTGTLDLQGLRGIEVDELEEGVTVFEYTFCVVFTLESMLIFYIYKNTIRLIRVGGKKKIT